MNLLMGGRAAQFAALYEANYGAIHAYSSRRVGGQAADEIAAETFLVAWRRWDAIPSDSLPWLYGVARNVVLQHHEHSSRQRRAQTALDHELRSQPGGAAEAEDPRLWEAWAQLRAADREVLALVAWEELSVADAARVLGCSAAVFSVRLHRARRRLERLLTAISAPRPATELSEA
jgi:RNA polymerase sigma-70 factor (ECF subfamily)